MNPIIYISLIIALFLLIRQMLPAKGVRHIYAADLEKELNDKSKQFIDVRTPGEYKGNHIRGFQNIPLHLLPKLAEKKLSLDREIILICQSGMRSQNACRILKKKGYTKLTNVKGGMAAWK